MRYPTAGIQIARSPSPRWRAAGRAVLFVAATILPLVSPNRATATTFTYEPSLANGARNAVTLFTHATLEAARTEDLWSAGDTIILAPGTYQTGALNLAAPNLTLQAANCVLVHSGNQPQIGTLRITASGVRVFGPLTARNTGTAGYVIQVDSFTQTVTDFLVHDVLVDQTPPGNGISPIRVMQSAPPQLDSTVSGTFRRVRLRAGANLPDGFAIGDNGALPGPRPSQSGTIWLIDCEAEGCNMAGNSNSMAADTRALAIVLGGTFSGSGAANLIGASTFFGRLFAFGAECSGGLSHPAVSVTNGEIAGEVVENCYIHHALTGVQLVGAPGSSQFGVVRGSRIVRDPDRLNGNTGATTAGTQGVRVLTSMAIVENCVIEGWRQAATDDFSGKIGTAIGILPVMGGSYVVRDCWLKDCYGGVSMTGAASAMLDVESCLLTQSPQPGALQPFSLYVSGNGSFPNAPCSIRLANNVVIWEGPALTGGMFINWNAPSSRREPLGGSNYFWHNNTIEFPWPGGWTAYPNDTVTSSAGGKPLIDSQGAQQPDSPAAAAVAFDVWDEPLFVRGRTTFASVADGTLFPTHFSTSLATPPGYFDNQTLWFVSGVNTGLWRRISASASGGLLTVSPAFPFSPDDGDLFTIQPPAFPSSGNTSSLDSNYFSLARFFNAPPLDPLKDDCNTNASPDIEELMAGLTDCNTDLIPDQCQSDCNTNGSTDVCEVDAASVGDCNTDRIPDVCNAAGAVDSLAFDNFDAPMLSAERWTTQSDVELRAWRAYSPPQALALHRDGLLESAAFDLAPHTAARIELRAAGDGGRLNSQLVTEFWDGSAWQTVHMLSAAAAGLDWIAVGVDLPPGALHAAFRFRFRRAGSQGGVWFVDDVNLKVSLPDCDGDGFSMACELDLNCDGSVDDCQICATGLRGDMDCNGQVTAADACGFVRALLHRAPLPADAAVAADVNADGWIDADDTREFLNLILSP